MAPPPLPPPPPFGAPLPVTPAPEVLRFLTARRSASAVTLAEPAPSASQLADLLRLAARAPDHGKLAPWRFVILEGGAKVSFADRLDALGQSRGDPTLSAKLVKLRTPPLAVAVVSSPKPGAIPEWEQLLSAGVVCTNLLYAALAMGFGANWITDWYSYDSEAIAILGLNPGERVAGFVLIGTPREMPMERDRPDVDTLVSYWEP
ncbi:nitroreductase family protein [Phenylobacterium kunshanense]|uniref:Putative NAD(P)H nitroreductase n=1 Tax=Phenylobacterium kunshanense TaxID=1445034 RepID=A0A328BI09_9CAUL|nr:nitroreductase [Phenylobacterium kunshanense]RAK66587.1 nitroreductase [Phenylobacterium kunshanense]